MSICQSPSAPFSLSLQAPSISRYVAFHKVGSTFTLVRSPWQLMSYRSAGGRVFSDQKGSVIEPFALGARSDAESLLHLPHTLCWTCLPAGPGDPKNHHLQHVHMKFPVLNCVCRLFSGLVAPQLAPPITARAVCSPRDKPQGTNSHPHANAKAKANFWMNICVCVPAEAVMI